jgi:hypothetical protein
LLPVGKEDCLITALPGLELLLYAGFEHGRGVDAEMVRRLLEYHHGSHTHGGDGRDADEYTG